MHVRMHACMLVCLLACLLVRERGKWRTKSGIDICDQLVFNCIVHFPNSALYNVTGLDVRVRKIEPHVERDFDEGSA